MGMCSYCQNNNHSICDGVDCSCFGQNQNSHFMAALAHIAGCLQNLEGLKEDEVNVILENTKKQY